MDTCEYESIDCDREKGAHKSTWKPFLKQVFICSSVWSMFFGTGLWIGTPTVVIPQLRKEANSSVVVSDEMESWLSSVLGYAALPWAIIFPIWIRLNGRKLPSIFASISSLTSFVVFYNSNTPMHIIAGEIVQGIIFASNVTVSILVLTEYSSPQYRGVFLTMKSASMNIGIWVANTMGTFFHWKSIPILGCVCTTYCLGAVFWPESPYWLAAKGRFEECAKVHRWLKGTDKESEKELLNLIESQKEYQKTHVEQLSPFTWIYFKRLVENIKSQRFYKPTLLSILMMALYHFSGKLVCTVYATQMINKISNSESTAYTGMLILDGVTVFTMYIGCVLSKILNRRTFLLSASLLGALFLYILSLYLYLVKLLIIKENKIASLFLLTAFSMSIGCGPLIMATSVYAELIPLRYKTLSITLTVFFTASFQGTLLKLSPDLFRNFGMHGTFFFFAISFSICIYLVYKLLPETKDKTLQEIETCFKHDSRKGEDLKRLNT